MKKGESRWANKVIEAISTKLVSLNPKSTPQIYL